MSELPASATGSFVERVIVVWETRGQSAAEALVEDAPAEIAAAVRARFDGLLASGLLPDPAVLPDAIGPYPVIDRLGAGAMGTVYLARGREDVLSRVAIKVIASTLSSSEFLARFREERTTLAKFDHPGIARILDAGSTVDHRPYFVMEHVAGGLPVTRFCETHDVSPSARLELFASLCDAVQHAHDHGVVHRDLKPANCLAFMRNGVPTIKVIDFGLAKVVSAAADTTLTKSGVRMGTLEYMSPEQARSARDIDERTDVYALGIMLYELLAGERPFHADSDRYDVVDQQRLLHEIFSIAPALPSRRLGTRTSQATTDATTTELHRRLRTELDWVIMKAIAKEPARRYVQARDLATEVRSHLAGHGVTARSPSTSQRIGAFARRRRRALTVAAVILLVAAIAAPFVLDTTQELQAARRDPQRQELVVAIDNGLFPAHPETIGDLKRWLATAEPLVDGANAEFEAAHQEATRRLTQAQSVTASSVTSHAAEWDAAIQRARAMPSFRDVALTPQVGLVPLGPHPKTKLEEFWHVASGTRPSRHADRGAMVEPDTGIVLVLLPPGSFLMGAQDSDETAPNYDPHGGRAHTGQLREGPVHRVEIFKPWFVSKFELTQGQYARMNRGRQPSFHFPGYAVPAGQPQINMAHPVEYVSATEAEQVLRIYALELPDEELWEYACRGAVQGCEPVPVDLASIRRNANVMDRSGRITYPGPNNPTEALEDDGYSYHSPVGSFRANGFGLHDMQGNVWEWCANDFYYYSGYPVEPGSRALRGGSFYGDAVYARPSARSFATGPEFNRGVRPVRRIR